MGYKSILTSGKNHVRACLFLAGFGVFSATSFSQTTVTVGNNTGTSVNIPLTTYYGYSYTQSIYYGSEIAGFGGFPGMVSKIRFYYSSGPTNNSDNWTVFMGNTTKTSFSGTTDWVAVGQMTQVFSGTVTFPGSTGWMEITLTNPFPYTGGNLVIAVDENAPSYSSSNSNWGITSTSGSTRSIYYRSDSNNPDPASPPSGTGTIQAYSDVQLDITAFPLCSGVPAPGNTISSISTECAGAPVNATLSLQNNYVQFSGISYQWQEFDGSNWINRPGDTSSVAIVPMPMVTTQYRCEVTCSGNGMALSNPVTITAHPLPNVSISPTSYAVCSGGSAVLTASGADSYSWSPATFLSGTTGNSVTSTPTAAITYTVTGVDTNGCQASVTTLVTPVSDLQISTSVSPQHMCVPGSLVTMDVDNIPTVGGNWEFQWTDTSGQNILQAWSPISQYSVTPTLPGRYIYRVSMRNTLCNNELPADAYVTVVVGFGASIISTDVNCNMPFGTITLTDVFGQYGLDTLYFDNFSVQPDPQATDLFGMAVVTGGRCIITPSATSIRGGFAVYHQGNQFSNTAEHEISFLLTTDQPINNFGTGGGDGIAYSFGDDAVYNGSANSPANGYGSKLRISFDAANNGNSNGNATGIYLTYGYASNDPMGPNTSGVLGYSSSTAWKLGTDVPVHIRISNSGLLTLTVGGIVIFNDVQLPPAYVAADKSNWIHLFSAHTGGDALRHGIDDLLILQKRLDFGITSSNNPPSVWQTSNVFDSLNPGSYNVWLTNPTDPNCSQNVATVVINDLNPVVNLGNDTVICNGSTLVLDAENVGSTYLWSDNSAQQTFTVNTTGTYWVQVIDTAGCMDIDAIHVSVAPPSSVAGITANNTGLDVVFTANNPQNTDTYTWDFGDGNTVSGPFATVSHTYAAYGTYTIQLIVTSAASCEPDTFTFTYVLTNNVGTETITENIQVQVFPNPADEYVMFGGKHAADITDIRIVDISGKMVFHTQTWQNGQQVDVSSWPAGMYVIRMQVKDRQMTEKLVVR